MEVIDFFPKEMIVDSIIKPQEYGVPITSSFTHQDLTSVMLWGGEIGYGPDVFLGWSHSVFGDFEACKFNVIFSFSWLRVIPCLPQISNQLDAWKKLSSIVSDQRRVSPRIWFCLGWMRISSYLLVYPSPEAM